MTYLYSFAPFENEYVISWPYKLKFKDWFLLNKLNIYKTLSLSKSYGDVVVYIDKNYINEFDKIIPDDIIVKQINLDKNNIWAISKFHSILNFIEEFKKPFVHLDFDAFLLKDILKNNENDIIVAFQESHKDIRFHHENTFNMLKEKKIFDLSKLNCGYTYNCSTVGGKNLNFIKDWCIKSIDYANQYKNVMNYNLTSVIEQSHLTKLLEDKKIKPYEIIQLNKDLNNFTLENHKEKVFIHDKFFGAELLSNDNPSFLRTKWYNSYNKITLESQKIF